MTDTLERLFRMFYPLTRTERQRWAKVISAPDPEYLSGMEEAAHASGVRQALVDGAVAWLEGNDRQLVLFFRVPDPGDLDAVRAVYNVLARSEAPLAYAFVHQLPDGEGTWDIFHMSRLSYLAHCNRVSGPGSQAENGAR